MRSQRVLEDMCVFYFRGVWMRSRRDLWGSFSVFLFLVLSILLLCYNCLWCSDCSIDKTRCSEMSIHSVRATYPSFREKKKVSHAVSRRERNRYWTSRERKGGGLDFAIWTIEGVGIFLLSHVVPILCNSLL